MKKTKIAIAVGSLVLAIGAFVTSKANKSKPFTTNDMYAAGIGYIVTAASSHPHLTLTANSHQAFLVTGTSSTKRALSISSGDTQEWYVF